MKPIRAAGITAALFVPVVFIALTVCTGIASQVTDEETGATYYVYDESDGKAPGHSGDSEPNGNGGVFNYSDYYDDSSDDILIDEEIAKRMNLDEEGTPIVYRLLGGNPGRKEVALTFDDGPHPRYTSKLLSILQHYRVRATFFMVGFQANRYPHWAKQVTQLGNEIGSHTYDHFRLTKLPKDEVTYQIKQTQDVVYQITGRYPRFIRPPGGRYNQDILEEFAKHGLSVALWTYNAKDIDIPDPDEVYRGIMDNLENGSIILMHDGSDATIAMLPRLIRGIEARGYKLVTLSEMFDGLEAGARPEESEETPAESYEDWRIRSFD